ncbi:3-deoxy-manno-octulosonate cytidylyltransferase, partial [Vibrio parahaemolyticus]|nr:3-deoxy-manno-octulosonate cytidylyltransferase [Vibrio parahaemolyticus]
MSFTVVIPARYSSSRLPGKPLADIGGKPMVQWVYEQAMQAGADDVIIATDDERVSAAVEQFGGKVCMTSPNHESGTERLAEVVEKMAIAADHIIVNVQGDEPLVPPVIIRQVADNLAASDAPMATLAVEIESEDEVFNPNAVKVVADERGYAMYFSRATIPW